MRPVTHRKDSILTTSTMTDLLRPPIESSRNHGLSVYTGPSHEVRVSESSKIKNEVPRGGRVGGKARLTNHGQPCVGSLIWQRVEPFLHDEG